MSRATFAILAIVCVSWAAAEGVNPPPHPLHKVGDHWTPYQPPVEMPADAQVYTIKAGDTLWALAKQFLGNPYLWPQLWEKNKYILDAHWIYPGDPLIIGPKVAEVPSGGAAETAPTSAPSPTPEPTGAGPQGAETAAPAESGMTGKLVAVGSEDDLYCFAYLDEKSELLTLKITSSELEEYQTSSSNGEIVYISGGEAEGVKAGQEYFLVMAGRELRHPATNAALGHLMHYVGHLRVLCTQDHSATAEILSACDPIMLGTYLKPFEPLPIPMTVLTAPATVCDPASAKARGYIVYSKDDVIGFGQDMVVMLDLGDADQVAPGTVCIVYRDNSHAGMPRLLLGELAVLSTGDHWATAKIIRSALPMYVGDRVEVK